MRLLRAAMPHTKEYHSAEVTAMLMRIILHTSVTEQQNLSEEIKTRT